MFDKLKLKRKGSDIAFCDPIAPPGTHPSKRDIYRNRQNYGVNIGLCFVQERWIFDKNFGDNAQTELQMAEALIKSTGSFEKAREQLQAFWKDFMTPEDWVFLAEAGVTAVRIPVGYWELDGGAYTKNSKFEKVAPLYLNAWGILRTHFIEPAAERGIGVLVDMHGLPGGANNLDHSGELCEHGANFWGDVDAQLAMSKAFAWLVLDLSVYDNFIGVQLCNEAEHMDSCKKQGLFYGSAINAIREVDPTIPVVISDAWDPNQWAKWVQDQQLGNNTIGVIVDDHIYRCFSGLDHNCLPKEIISNLGNTVLNDLPANGRGVDFMIGEYLCVLDGQLWLKGDSQSHRDELVVEYGQAQSIIFSQRAKWGSFFWTYKFELGNGGEWDFRTMTNAKAIYPAFTIRGDLLPDDNVFDKEWRTNCEEHNAYWDDKSPGEKMDHDLYAKGFRVGWFDALEFAKLDGSVIGRVEAWRALRMQEHIHNHAQAKYEWEYAEGFNKALDVFYGIVRKAG